MPQIPVPVLRVSPTITTPLQAPISLQNSGSMVQVGAEGPIIFSSYGSLVASVLAGGALRGQRN